MRAHAGSSCEGDAEEEEEEEEAVRVRGGVGMEGDEDAAAAQGDEDVAAAQGDEDTAAAHPSGGLRPSLLPIRAAPRHPRSPRPPRPSAACSTPRDSSPSSSVPGCTPKPHQPTVTFAETSGSLLESSDEEEEEGVNEALLHADAARSSCSLSPAHFESTHHRSGAKSRGCYRCGGGFWGRDHCSVETLEAEAAALPLGPAAAAAFGSNFMIPLGLFAWFVERWVVPFANWVPLAAAVWAIIQVPFRLLFHFVASRAAHHFLASEVDLSAIRDQVVRHKRTTSNQANNKAHMALNDIDAAVESFKHALELEPTDGGIKRELAAAKKEIADRRGQERKAFARMFQPSGKSDKNNEESN